MERSDLEFDQPLQWRKAIRKHFGRFIAPKHIWGAAVFESSRRWFGIWYLPGLYTSHIWNRLSIANWIKNRRNTGKISCNT